MKDEGGWGGGEKGRGERLWGQHVEQAGVRDGRTAVMQGRQALAGLLKARVDGNQGAVVGIRRAERIGSQAGTTSGAVGAVSWQEGTHSLKGESVE